MTNIPLQNANKVQPAGSSPRQTRQRQLVVGIGTCLLMVAAATGLPEFHITLLNYIGLYSLVALGLVLLTGVGGLTSFGQAAFVGLGAYTTAYLTTVYGASPWLGLLCGLALTASVSYLLGAMTLRLSGHYLPLGTLAWGISLYFLFGSVGFLGGFSGLGDVPALTLFGIDLRAGRNYFYLIWTLTLLSAVLVRNLLDSRAGRSIRALKGGIVMAEAMGVDTARTKIVIFVIAAVLAALSGWLYAHLQRLVNPTPFSLAQGIEYLFMAVVGGAGSVWGAVLGAAVITLLKHWLQDLLPRLFGQSGDFEVIVFGILIILVLQLARDGLWGQLQRLFRHLAPWALRMHLHIPDSTAALPRRPVPQRGQTVLELRQVGKRFGGLLANQDMSLTVGAGEIVALIGPNGAGKSTLFNCISGVNPPSSGEVLFMDRRVDGLQSREIAQMGLSRTFQHVRLMPLMTVLENVAIGAHLRGRQGVFAAALRLDRVEEGQLLADAALQIARTGLGEQQLQPAGSLALGQQRIVEIARALAADPTLLLLDEPAAGLRHLEKQALATLLRKLRAEGMAILLVEHDMDFVMGLADRIVVMEFGKKLAEGLPEEIQCNPAVLAAYLGDDEEETA